MGAVDPLASDADRERTALQLRDAAADGRLTLEELTGRLDLAYAARTHGDLEGVTRDLATAQPPRARTALPRRRVTAIMSGSEVRGRLRIDGTMHVTAVMGGVQIDLTQAEIVDGEATIDLKVAMGGVEIMVPPGVEVDAHGLITIMGGHSARVPGGSAHAPLIRLRGLVVMGGVDVRVKGAPGPELPPG
jgi:hypothetical protein